MEPAQKPPIVISLGKNSRKRIKKLKRGEGNLISEVHQRLAALKSAGRIADGAEVVVFIVERRPELSMPCFSPSRFFSM